jgi:PAS domain S-box-containing protein
LERFTLLLERGLELMMLKDLHCALICEEPSSTESARRETLIRHLMEGTSAQTGLDFFHALVRSAAMAMNVAGVWVTEYLPEQQVLRSLAFWMNGHYVEDYVYTIPGTPCEQVIENACLIHYPDRVIELFPGDPDLVKLSAVSYAGVPLLKADGSVLGHLSALDTKPLHLVADVESVFRIFAARAGAELRRIRAESAVRDSEQRFSRLFESAMDAIFELDDGFRILRANASAATLFAIPSEILVNRSLTTLLTPRSMQKLVNIAQQLDMSGQHSAWVPGGFEAVRSDESGFPAEGSVSRFELAGGYRYSVILRNVQEQLAAENRLRELEEETAYLQSEIEERHPFGEIIGESPAICEVLSAVRQVAATPTTVLITGETGTGKELVARAIHKASQRASNPFIRVNCAAIPAPLCESEFFGHERGAFTGAVGRRPGRFELAQGGIIFLDEVGELPLELQPKLLRVLQEREYEPVGSSQTRKVDVRVIASTNRDLSAEVAAGRFREDLFYRLNVFPISVPPLRDRSTDVELLTQFFIDRYCARIGKPRTELTADCLRRLRSYHWPGNVRELENVVERAVIIARDRTLSLRNVLPLASLRSVRVVGSGGSHKPRTKRELREMERETLIQALERAAWKVAGAQGAARALGVPSSTLASRMKALQIERPKYRTLPPLCSRTIAREIETKENSLAIDSAASKGNL